MGGKQKMIRWTTGHSHVHHNGHRTITEPRDNRHSHDHCTTHNHMCMTPTPTCSFCRFFRTQLEKSCEKQLHKGWSIPKDKGVPNAQALLRVLNGTGVDILKPRRGKTFENGNARGSLGKCGLTTSSHSERDAHSLGENCLPRTRAPHEWSLACPCFLVVAQMLRYLGCPWVENVKKYHIEFKRHVVSKYPFHWNGNHVKLWGFVHFVNTSHIWLFLSRWMTLTVIWGCRACFALFPVVFFLAQRPLIDLRTCQEQSTAAHHWCRPKMTFRPTN